MEKQHFLSERKRIGGGSDGEGFSQSPGHRLNSEGNH